MSLLRLRAHAGQQAPGREQLFLGCDELRRVKGEQVFTLPNGLAGRAHVEVLDEPPDLRRHQGLGGLGRFDPTDRTDGLLERHPLHGRKDHPERALLRLGQAHRLARRRGTSPVLRMVHLPVIHPGHRVGGFRRIRLAARRHESCRDQRPSRAVQGRRSMIPAHRSSSDRSPPPRSASIPATA